MGPKMRMTQVVRIIDISPHMRRIVLSGSDLHDFPTEQESAHVKAIFPRPGETMPKLGSILVSKKWMRSYTIRNFDNISKELSIDFAVNDHQGLATDWARQTKVGDFLGIAGPGETKHTNYNADWHLIVADLTALPAAAAILEKLPDDATGYALVQVPTEQDMQSFRVPNGVLLEWVVSPYQPRNLLLESVKQLVWKAGVPAIFIAAESGHMQAIKLFVKSQPGYSKIQTYASGYWKA